MNKKPQATIHIWLPDELVARLDELALREDRSRSAMAARLLKAALTAPATPQPD